MVMPNPSSIAMEDDSADNDAVTEAFDEMFLSSAKSASRHGCLGPVPDDSPDVEIEIVTVPEGTPDAVVKLLEERDDDLMELELGFDLTAGIMTESVEALAEEQAKVRDLTAALGHVGASNLELTEQVTMLKSMTGTVIAEAAARFIKARRVFERYEAAILDGDHQGSIPDAVTEEVAVADAELERLLETAGLLEG